MAGIKARRQKELQNFLELCHRVGFEPEPFQVKIAGALLGPEREKLVMLPRKNGKSRLVGTYAAWHLLTTPKAQAYIAANSEEQARVVFEYARSVALHPAVDQEFTVRYRELRRPDGGYLRVRAADPSKLLGLTPSLAVLDEYCEAKDDGVYTALRTALLPGATMFTITTAGMGAESPLGRLRARALGQPDVRVRGALTDARGEGIRMLEWGVDPDTSLDDYTAAKKANPLSLITPRWLKEQREAVHELHYRRFHRNEWTSRIGSWLPAGAWQNCANGVRPKEGSKVWVGVDVGGARADTAIVWIDEQGAIDCVIWSGDDAVMDAMGFLPELAQRFQVIELVVDPWRAQVLGKNAEQHGIKVTMFPQSDNRMIPASAALHQAIVEGKIHHPDDPKLNEHVAAAVAKHGRRGWRIDQAERGTNIDGLIALVMAYEANFLVSVRKCITTLRAAGYQPNLILLKPSDSEAVDTMVSGISGGTADFVFGAAKFAPGTLFGIPTVESKVLTASVVMDTRAHGALYLSPLSLARFEENAGRTNSSLIRLEGHAAYGTERTAAAVRIAAS